MSASKESLSDSAPCPKKIGILAGGGSAPDMLARSCSEQGIEVFIVGFEGQTEAALLKTYPHLSTKLGRTAKVINVLRGEGIEDIVLIGSIKRPSFSDLAPDFKTIEFFTRLGFKALGDNDLLSELRAMLEREGFKVHGAHRFASDLLAPAGPLGAYEPSPEDWIDIKRGIEVVQTLGMIDIGQAVIVQEGIVLGVEAAEGTDALIARCAGLKRKGRGGVLVKLCKPQQDTDLDLPTIGPKTLEEAAKAKLNGIIIHAGHGIVLEPHSIAKIADQHKMFVVGISVQDYQKA